MTLFTFKNKMLHQNITVLMNCTTVSKRNIFNIIKFSEALVDCSMLARIPSHSKLTCVLNKHDLYHFFLSHCKLTTLIKLLAKHRFALLAGKMSELFIQVQNIYVRVRHKDKVCFLTTAGPII